MPPSLTAARRNYRTSALIAERAVREARKVRGRGARAVLGVVAAQQIAQAATSRAAVGEMLAEQDIPNSPDAVLNVAAFTTGTDTFAAMVEQVEVDWQFNQLVASLVQDAGRAAESVAVASRPNIAHVRYVNPPCCSRCAILAGRVYRWSQGFQRHPGCDCTMIPTTVASELRQDPEQLVRDGLVRGLSKADRKALDDGADLARVVNVRSRKSGLLVAGQALARAGKPTPAGIYRAANGDRADALRRLALAGYIH